MDSDLLARGVSLDAARTSRMDRAVTTRAVQIVCGAGIVSGKEIVSLHLARGLRDAGWEPQFMTSNWGDGEFVRRLENDDIPYQRLRLGFISTTLRVAPLLMTLDQLRYWPALVYGYLRIIARTAPRAVIHTNWHHALLLLPFLRPHRDIYWAHELFPNVPHYARIMRAIAKRVGRVVCVSDAVARSIEVLGVPKSKVKTVHNGIPLVESISAQGDQRKLRLGIVGQIGPWKGHVDLIDALALLPRDDTQVSLQIFGTGAPGHIRSLESRITELNLADQVEWCGFVRDQAEIYSRIDVCVVPSRCDEALGMTALEASGFGRPVITSDRGGLPEVVVDGVTGFVVEAQSPNQLAQAIKSLVCSPDLVKSMGEAGRKRIQSEFSLDRCVRQFIGVVEDLKAQADRREDI